MTYTLRMSRLTLSKESDRLAMTSFYARRVVIPSPGLSLDARYDEGKAPMPSTVPSLSTALSQTLRLINAGANPGIRSGTENYQLYRDTVITNRLTQRQSVSVPLMKRPFGPFSPEPQTLPISSSMTIPFCPAASPKKAAPSARR